MLVRFSCMSVVIAQREREEDGGLGHHTHRALAFFWIPCKKKPVVPWLLLTLLVFFGFA